MTTSISAPAPCKPSFPPLTPDQQSLFDNHFLDAEKLARHLYRRYQSNRIQHESEDFLAMAHFALVKAARGWNPERGVLFWSYLNAIFRQDIVNHYQKKQMLCRKCPTREISVEVLATRGEFLAGHASKEIKAIDDRDEVEFLHAIAEGLPQPTAKRNWNLVVSRFCHGMTGRDAGAKFGVKRSNAILVIQETVARVRARALAHQK